MARLLLRRWHTDALRHARDEEPQVVRLGEKEGVAGLLDGASVHIPAGHDGDGRRLCARVQLLDCAQWILTAAVEEVCQYQFECELIEQIQRLRERGRRPHLV